MFGKWSKKWQLSSGLAALFLLLLSPSARAEVKLPAIYQDGAILQRNKPLTITGTALPGEIVNIQIGPSFGQLICDKSGTFSMTLPAVKQTGPFQMKVTGQKPFVLNDIRFGEVWLVAGEGLMEATLKEETEQEELHKSKKEEAGESTGDGTSDADKRIYLYREDVLLKKEPEKIGHGHWFKATSPEKMEFSALGYSLAKHLSEKIEGPIAIIQVSVPNSPLRAWISAETLQSRPDIRSVVRKGVMDDENFNLIWTHYKLDVKEAAKAKEEGREFPRPTPAAEICAVNSVVQNGMLAPIAPYALRGVVFCQGEADTKAPVAYKTLFPALITDLRLTFKQESLPFVFVQLGALPSTTPEKEVESPAAIIRNTQYKARLAPKSYMVISSDLCSEEKKTGNVYMSAFSLAERISNTVLATQYGIKRPFLYPTVESVEAEGDGLKVTFRNPSGALRNKDKPPVRGFFLAGFDRKFYEGKAKLDGNTVFVECPFVKMPKFVRYGWGNNPYLSLFSEDGLPAAPYTNDR